jgi:hypothetical protein
MALLRGTKDDFFLTILVFNLEYDLILDLWPSLSGLGSSKYTLTQQPTLRVSVLFSSCRKYADQGTG